MRNATKCNPMKLVSKYAFVAITVHKFSRHCNIVFICRSYFHSMHQSAGIINTDMGFEAKIIHVAFLCLMSFGITLSACILG